MPVFLRWMCVVLLSLSLTACKPAPQTLALVAGSENKALEALVTQLGRQHGVQVAFTYLGSVDIGREIQKGTRVYIRRRLACLITLDCAE